MRTFEYLGHVSVGHYPGRYKWAYIFKRRLSDVEIRKVTSDPMIVYKAVG